MGLPPPCYGAVGAGAASLPRGRGRGIDRRGSVWDPVLRDGAYCSWGFKRP